MSPAPYYFPPEFIDAAEDTPPAWPIDDLRSADRQLLNVPRATPPPTSYLDRLAMALAPIINQPLRSPRKPFPALLQGLLQGAAGGFTRNRLGALEQRQQAMDEQSRAQMEQAQSEHARQTEAVRKRHEVAMENWRKRRDARLGVKAPKTPKEIEAEAFASSRGHARGAASVPKPSSADGGGAGSTSPPVKLRPPTAKERADLAADAAALEQQQAIRKLYKPDLVGPLAGRRGSFSQTTGIGSRPGETDFRAALAIYQNAVISALSGATVPEAEMIRMKKQIPNENDPSQVFEAKLRQTEANLRRIAEMKRRTLEETGVDVVRLSPLPMDPPRKIDLRQFVRP